MKAILFALLCLTVAGATSYADDSHSGIYLEPGLQYEAGSFTANFPQPYGNVSGTTQGFGFDLKAGFHFADILYVVADGTVSQPNTAINSQGYSASSTSNLLGADVGVRIPLTGLHFWAGYIFTGTLDPQSSNNTDFKFSNATGYKVGAGFGFLHISLNLEYESLSYGMTTLQAYGPFATNAVLNNTQLNNNVWVGSVSLPFAL